jgi:hypothetical protein
MALMPGLLILQVSATTCGPSKAVPLAPLGGVRRVGGEKMKGLSDDEVKVILEEDISGGQYFVTGNLTREIFDDQCR